MAERLTENKVGAIAYSIYVEGELVETVVAEDPIEYLHGYENIVPGLEAALAGKQAGDQFDVTLAPADAYGDYDQEQVQEIPIDEFDFDEEDATLEVGMEIEMMDEDGDIIEGVILEVREDSVVVDLNPPLAGKSVRYAGQVLGVRDATEEELEWGFPESLLNDMFGEDDWDEDEADHAH
jgi:FKBP-type peptidyl-prolyl cis-trans isomerase SlyD